MFKAKKLENGTVCMVLSETEVEILYAICRNIGGHPNTSGRWAIDNILNALRKEEVMHIDGMVKSGMIMQLLAEESSFRGDNNDKNT